MVLVGSSALKFHYPSLDRDINDLDFIATLSEVEELTDILLPSKRIEKPGIIRFCNIQNKTDKFNHSDIEFLIADGSESLKMYLDHSKSDIADPDVLLSLKKSHIHFPVNFNKHIGDYNFLLNQLKEDKLPHITKINFKETEKRLGDLKTPSLKKSTQKFFGQSNGFVKDIYIHDHIHLVMSHYDRPIYMDMQDEGASSAWCQKDKWNQFTFEKKAKCVLEEAYVISLERKIIPMLNGFGAPISSKKAFEWSIMRICTTLCSGWFRQFATDNYSEIIKFYNPGYVSKFLRAEQDGKIKRQNA